VGKSSLLKQREEEGSPREKAADLRVGSRGRTKPQVPTRVHTGEENGRSNPERTRRGKIKKKGNGGGSKPGDTLLPPPGRETVVPFFLK